MIDLEQDHTPEVAALYAELFPPREAPQASNGTPAEAAPPPGPEPAQQPPERRERQEGQAPRTVAEMTDDELWEVAERGKNGARIRRLKDGDTSDYDGDESRAECALLADLAFYTNRDVPRMERMFKQTALYRAEGRAEKWARDSYREPTLAKALEGVTKGYTPPRPVKVSGREKEGGSGAAGDSERPRPTDDFPTTDLGNGERLIARHGRDLLYCPAYAAWLIHDSRRWEKDEACRIEALAAETARGLYESAWRAPEAERREKFAKWAVYTESSKGRAAMISSARHLRPVRPEQLDADPLLFNVLNGTLDLRTGILRPHRREDLITRLAPVEYRPSARCPTFEAFLRRILAEDEALIGFIRRAIGYSLTGLTGEKCFFIPYGSGDNGKTTLLEVVRDLLGDYALRTATDTLMVKRENAVPNDLARLKGARFVFASEAEEGRRLAVSLVKDLTGGDTISARFMRAEWFDFRPEFKLWLATNHKPMIRDANKAIWTRVRLLPFTVSIPKEEQDRNLLAKLRDELPGILRWAVEGCLEWQARGLQEPAAVIAATESYREEMDLLAAFLAERCIEAPDASASAAALYGTYREWSDRSGERPLTQQLFGSQLSQKGYERRRGAGGRHRWVGIGLREAASDPLSGAESLLSGLERGETEPTAGESDPLSCLGDRPTPQNRHESSIRSHEGLCRKVGHGGSLGHSEPRSEPLPSGVEEPPTWLSLAPGATYERETEAGELLEGGAL